MRKKSKETEEVKKSNSPTKRYSAGRTSRLRRLWGWCRDVCNGVLCRESTRGKYCLLTKLTRTEHHLEANGRNTIYNNKNQCRARCDDGRIGWKLVDLKNSSIVGLIGGV